MQLSALLTQHQRRLLLKIILKYDIKVRRCHILFLKLRHKILSPNKIMSFDNFIIIFTQFMKKKEGVIKT